MGDRAPVLLSAAELLTADGDAAPCGVLNISAPCALGLRDPAYAIYTSGSTGRPKCVLAGE